MRNRKSPLEYYRTLGLQPGASKKDLRKAYLRLVKDCHPDRFARNPQAQFLAQEKLKQINEAYSFLRDCKPDGVYEVWSYPDGSTAQWREYRRRTSYEPPIVDPFEGDYQYRPVGGSGKGIKFAWAFVALMLLNILGYTNFPSSNAGIADHRNVAEASSPSVPVANTAHPDAMQVVFLGDENRGDWISAKRMVPYFFVGSNKEDVYRVQGIPDWSNEREWRYGDSRVYFVGNGVQSWKSGARVPLKAIDLGHAGKRKILTVGADPADVLSIQGAPDSISESYWQASSGKVSKTMIWHYGTSKIQFSDGKMTGWEAGIGSPLKVKE
jgi:hypothetical protein